MTKEQYTRFIILTVFNNHMTDDIAKNNVILSTSLNKIEEWINNNPNMLNSYKWINQQFSILYGHGFTNIMAKYDSVTKRWVISVKLLHAPLLTSNGVQELIMLRKHIN